MTPFIDEVYPLYLNVYNRSKLQFEKLTKEYLCRLGPRDAGQGPILHLAAEGQGHRLQRLHASGRYDLRRIPGPGLFASRSICTSIFTRFATSSPGR